jgi:hypothetical protein
MAHLPGNNTWEISRSRRAPGARRSFNGAQVTTPGRCVGEVARPALARLPTCGVVLPIDRSSEAIPVGDWKLVLASRQLVVIVIMIARLAYDLYPAIVKVLAVWVYISFGAFLTERTSTRYRTAEAGPIRNEPSSVDHNKMYRRGAGSSRPTHRQTSFDFLLLSGHSRYFC